MNLRLIIPSLLALLLLTSGCTMMQPKGDELATKIDALLAEKKYGDALDMLAQVPPASPDYTRFAEKRKQVEALAAQYERKTIDEAHQMVVQDRWTQALNLYDEALQRLPRSSRLRDGLAELHQQQQLRLAAQDNELVIAKGEWLANMITIYRRKATIDPYDSSYKNQLESYQGEGTRTAETLFTISTQAQASGNEELAGRALSLAARLSDKKEIQQAAQKYEQSHVKDSRGTQDKRWRDLAQREQERSEAIRQLSNEYAGAMKQKDYLAARTTLGRLRSIAPELVAEKGYEKELNEKIDAESNRLYNEGVMYYGRSQFERARDSWMKTLELTPTHTKAHESLDRVEKVLKRINQLRSKQKAE